MRKNFLIVAILAIGVLNFAEAQTVYFNGLGRALVTNDNLKGLALDPDTTGSIADTANTRKGTGGYTLFDLGINAQPSENLRAAALLRVRNEFGGFYGQGSRLEFRQLRLDGILNNVVKYQIGDIDLSMTPYTLYNFAEIYHDYEADIFQIRRSIVQYENFNFGNNWRLQGFHATSALEFDKYIDKIGVGGFATRTRRSNFLDLPDRLLVGGEFDLTQSEYLQIGANYVRFFDVPNTAPSPITDFENDVITADYRLKYEVAELVGLSLYGEVGMSEYSYDSSNVIVTEDDYFYDLGLSAKYNPLNLKVFGSYRYVGPFFSSPAAQTRRIYDQGIPDLFPSVGNNEMIARSPLLFDRLTDETLRNQTIQPFLMSYLPQFNAITPYGIATPNRKGFTFGLAGGGEDKVYTADIIVDLLSEVSGEGTVGENNKRDFFGVKGGGSVAVNKLVGWEKDIVVNGGFRYEQVEREANPIDFNSLLLDAGLTVEVVDRVDILGGLKRLTAEGNEFVALRNPYNQIVGFRSLELDTKQSIYAFGMRYRFSRNTFFTAQGLFIDYTDETFKFNNYKINQLFLSYTMVF